MASSIPKFASFRPKPKLSSYAEPSKEVKIIEEEYRPEKQPARSRERSPSRPKQASSIKDFFSDRRGDPEVLRYGTLNRYDIPAYRRYGNNYILGLSVHEKIDREYSTDSKVYTTSATRQRQERLLTKKDANKSGDRSLRLIKANHHHVDLDQDFIPIPGTGKRKRRESNSDRDETTQELDYRGFNQEGDLKNPVDLDTLYESDIYANTFDSEAIRKNSEFFRRTREYPQDLQGWLALIKHQEDMVKLERPSTELSTSDKAQLADVRITIYEEALKKIGADQLSVEALYKGLMREAQKNWDVMKLTSKWKEILSKHPHCVDLWFMYLDFEQSSFGRFKFEDCRLRYFRCLESLRSKPDAVAVETVLHILLRLTSMIQEAGYQELALAIWQAILEFHVMRSSTPNKANLQDNLLAFEEFWESEVQRIGESSAKGWEVSSREEDAPSDVPVLQNKNVSGTSFGRFKKHEVEATEKLRYPGRSSDDVGEDDAFHIIFFSDIESYLNILPFNASYVLIIEAFICFCGLPPLARTTTYQQVWRTDPFLQHSFNPSSCSEDEASNFMKSFLRYSNCPIKGFQMGPRMLFDQNFSLERIRLSADFLGRILNLVALHDSDDAIGEYLLAFELCHFPDQVQKTAKLLLKAHPSSLRLYNAYGLVEARRGNFSKADQVFRMALSIQNAKAPLSNMAGLELFSNWAWMALRGTELTEALWRLVSPDGLNVERATQEARPDQSSLLRIENLLSATSERALLSRDYSSAILSTSLLALLTYLTDDLNIAAALATHQNLTAWFKSHKLFKSPHAELHAQSIALLLSYHVTHAPITKPALLRTALSPLISQFPENTHILALFSANEARSAIEDRVRSIMQQSTAQSSESTSVISWAFAIHHETLRGEIAGSTSHSIRALYKRATESTGAHCPAFWKAYLEFEIAQWARERSKWSHEKPSKSGKKSSRETRVEEMKQRTKDVFYAGMRKLPWCKDFMMMAFTEARELFEEDELWRVYRILQEKELRLYTELDEKGMMD